MKMLPSKELEAVKLKYVENEAGLAYDVLRRQVEFWLESLQSSGPIPMGLGTLQPTDVSKLIEEELEGALLVSNSDVDEPEQAKAAALDAREHALWR